MGEFELIAAIRAMLGRAEIGDDCAVLAPEPGRELLVTTDAAIEGVHFDLRWMTAEQAGARAMAANLSDVAAMAGRPRWATLALALPRGTADEVALALVRGAAGEAARSGAAVVGGNIARAPDAIALTIALLGDVEAGRAVTRAGARPGDELWVTGQLGWARAGLEALRRGRGGEPVLAPVVERFRRPRARVAEAAFLRDRAGARAMIDLSDGLAGDVAHLARESRVGVAIDRAALPVEAPLAAAAAALGVDARDLALEGGEDYELLVAAPPGAVEAARGEFEAKLGVPLTLIGRVEAVGGVRLAGGGAWPAGGFDHLRE